MIYHTENGTYRQGRRRFPASRPVDLFLSLSLSLHTAGHTIYCHIQAIYVIVFDIIFVLLYFWTAQTAYYHLAFIRPLRASGANVVCEEQASPKWTEAMVAFAGQKFRCWILVSSISGPSPDHLSVSLVSSVRSILEGATSRSNSRNYQVTVLR